MSYVHQSSDGYVDTLGKALTKHELTAADAANQIKRTARREMEHSVHGEGVKRAASVQDFRNMVGQQWTEYSFLYNNGKWEVASAYGDDRYGLNKGKFVSLRKALRTAGIKVAVPRGAALMPKQARKEGKRSARSSMPLTQESINKRRG